MFEDLSQPEMRKVINQARAERSREIARLVARLFRRRSQRTSSVAVS